jgi:hypothetical protein
LVEKVRPVEPYGFEDIERAATSMAVDQHTIVPVSDRKRRHTILV